MKGERREGGKRRRATALYGPVTPESLARQAGAHATPRQLRSTIDASVALLVTPVHVARQCGTGSVLQKKKIGLVLKY